MTISRKINNGQFSYCFRAKIFIGDKFHFFNALGRKSGNAADGAKINSSVFLHRRQ